MKSFNGIMRACSVATLMVAGAVGIASADDFRVGYSNLADTDVFAKARKDGLIEAVAADPEVKISFTDANLDVSKQLDQVDNFIAQQMNAIIVVPVDYAGIVPGVESANLAGIPVIALGIASAGGTSTYVGSTNYDAGKMQGEYMVTVLPENAKILYLEGTPGMYHSVERIQGFQDAIKKRPDVELLASISGNYDRAEGMRVTEDWIQRYPQFDAIVAANDQMALGALEALKTAGRQEGVLISGIDGTADAFNAIKAGEMAQTIFQNAKGQAEAAFEVLEMIKAGEEAPAEKIVPFESVTAENVEQYM